MNIRLMLILLLSSGSALAADLDALQGTWKFTKVIAQGEESPPDSFKMLEWCVTGDAYALRNLDSDVERGHIRADTKKSPAELDFKVEPLYQEPESQLFIYKIDKDELTMASMGRNKPDRPKTFDPKAAWVVTTYHRTSRTVAPLRDLSKPSPSPSPAR